MIVLTDKHKIPFKIDDDDYEAVSRYPWRINSDGYPVTNIGQQPTRRVAKLHEFLLGSAPEGHQWDHENRNRLDGRRDNLRAVTLSVNAQNRSLAKNNSSGVGGVHWSKWNRRWVARIRLNRKQINLGSFRQFEMACAKRWAAESFLHPCLDRPGITPTERG